MIISLPNTTPYDYRITLKDDPSKYVLNVRKMPSWFKSGDVIEYRHGRTFAVSLTETEPRWRRLLNTLVRWWR